MGLLTIIGVSIIAERIGSKVQSMVEDSHRTDYDKKLLQVESNTRIVEMQETTKRENAMLHAEIARMHEETERMREETARAKARISAEAKIQAERIRAASQVATAAILSSGERQGYNISNSFAVSDATYSRSTGGIPRNREIPGLIPNSDSDANYCPFCGNNVSPGSFFCRNCGKRVK